MTYHEKTTLVHGADLLRSMPDHRWDNISLNTLKGPNKKVTQMLKACNVRRHKKMVKLEVDTIQVLQADYARMFDESTISASFVPPTIVKIQWLRSFNEKHETSSNKEAELLESNAQHLHRDYEPDAESETQRNLIAHSCVYTLSEESKMIVLVRVWCVGCMCGSNVCVCLFVCLFVCWWVMFLILTCFLLLLLLWFGLLLFGLAGLPQNVGDTN